MATTKIQATKNYALFKRHDGENRPLDLAKHRRLKKSMQKYGFLKCYPIICYRDKNAGLVVKDGQHRLAIAHELGLTVWWVEEKTDFDVAIVNSAQKGWINADYARKFAANGIAAYQEILDLADRAKVPVSTAAALLAGTTVFANISEQYYGGTFKVKDKKWAESVASLYAQLIGIGPAIRNFHFLGACMAVCRVPEFKPERLVAGAEKCRHLLVAYANRDAYLDMIEKVYNFGRKSLIPVKLPAINAMRERNPRSKKEKAAAADPESEAA